MKLVKNEMVTMDWNADGFVETKKLGFISAVHEYNGVAVAFRDGNVYTMIDDDGEVVSFSDLVAEIKTAVKEKDADYPYYYDDYAVIYDGNEFTEETLDYLEIAEFKEDIEARLKDLSGYWHEITVESL